MMLDMMGLGSEFKNIKVALLEIEYIFAGIGGSNSSLSARNF